MEPLLGSTREGYTLLSFRLLTLFLPLPASPCQGLLSLTVALFPSLRNYFLIFLSKNVSAMLLCFSLPQDAKLCPQMHTPQDTIAQAALEQCGFWGTGLCPGFHVATVRTSKLFPSHPLHSTKDNLLLYEPPQIIFILPLLFNISFYRK